MGIKEKLKNFFIRIRSRKNPQLAEKNQNINEDKYDYTGLEDEQDEESFSEKLKKEYPIIAEYTKIRNTDGKFIGKMYSHSIILIGPSGAGKSTVSEELAQMTGMRRVRLDGIANEDRRTGYTGNFRNVEIFNLDMIKKVIERVKENRNPVIIDFGAGHSIYENEERFNELKSVLEDFENIVLLLPSRDVEESIRIMKQRSTGDTSDNRRFIESPCNKELATMMIYGWGRKPKEIASEILVKIAHRREKENKIGEDR